MLESYSPPHQGMGLHLHGSPGDSGLRIMAMLHHAAASQAEHSLLWPLCAQLQRLGQSVLVIDGSQSESARTPGLAQLLSQTAWQAATELRSLAERNTESRRVATLPARLGLARLRQSAQDSGLAPLSALQRYVRGYSTVLIYASAEALTPLLGEQSLQPLLVLPPDTEHLIESYRQIKHLAVFADTHCTLAALEGSAPPEGPQRYDWSRKQSSIQSAAQDSQTRLQRLDALLQCSQRHLGDAPVLLRMRWRQVSDLHQLTLHMLKTACILPMHEHGLQAVPGADAAALPSLAWSH
ncbi:MAG: hypothetical protein RR718_00145 [Comamonas sp.]